MLSNYTKSTKSGVPAFWRSQKSSENFSFFIPHIRWGKNAKKKEKKKGKKQIYCVILVRVVKRCTSPIDADHIFRKIRWKLIFCSCCPTTEDPFFKKSFLKMLTPSSCWFIWLNWIKLMKSSLRWPLHVEHCFKKRLFEMHMKTICAYKLRKGSKQWNWRNCLQQYKTDAICKMENLSCSSSNRRSHQNGNMRKQLKLN